MNRYLISGKLSFGDAVEVGKLNAVVVKDPEPFTEKAFSGGTPNPTMESLVTVDHDDSAPESQHIPREQPVDFSLEFDAPDGDAALEWGVNEIEARADVLTFLTLNPVEVQGMMSCVEITPGKHKELESIHEGSAQHAPEVLLTEFFADVMAGRTLRGKLSTRLLGLIPLVQEGTRSQLGRSPRG